MSNSTKTNAREVAAKISAAMTLDYVTTTVQQLDALAGKREQWENGVYKKANDGLYDLLADTLALYLNNCDKSAAADTQGKKNVKGLRQELAERLKAEGVKVQKNSATLGMLVRFVFKSDRKRTHGYSQVLSAALQDEVKPSELADYIKAAGGVEEIKRRMVLSETAKAKREQVTANAETVRGNVDYWTLNPLAKVQLEAEGDCVVLLAKPTGDGFVNIVGVLDEVNEALMNALMLRMAKKAIADGKAVAPIMPTEDTSFGDVAATATKLMAAHG